MQALAERVQGKRVFLTIDLDALDPAIMPATGTPEPGGLGWYDVLDIIRTVTTHAEVIAFDCVELSPIPGLHAPDFLAAKLVYKTLSLILSRRAVTGVPRAAGGYMSNAMQTLSRFLPVNTDVSAPAVSLEPEVRPPAPPAARDGQRRGRLLRRRGQRALNQSRP